VKAPLVSGKEVVRALGRLGFQEVPRKGSHVKMEHSDGRKIVFPFYPGVDRYTLKGALRDAGVDLKEFVEAC
jgi:predicted RNA binding protein YcfA (HicA-like mRNA interferase family)